METAVNKHRIAKNTILLYVRMLFVMVVSLFTSRVILEKLGVENYGIYQTVGGIVGMLSFINSALSSGTSRFITFELGKNDFASLRKTFSTCVSTQLILCAIIVLLAETLGLWFVKHKLTIEPGILPSAISAYHLSIFTTIFSLLSVPYVAAIIAHEKMNVFAYVGIIEVCAKLGVAYLISVGNFNRLVFYASLLLIIQLSLTSFYIGYCNFRLKETKYKALFDRKIFRDIAGFSGWSLFAATAIALNNQGVLVLLNMFFAPQIVAARAISLQVNHAANQFVSNFRTAINPQIVKQYAAGNFEQSKNLLLSSTKYSFFLMFIIALPICMAAQPLLQVWLKEVPPYSTIFLQIVIIQSLFQVFDTSFYTALYAKGDLRLNALVSPGILFIVFPIVYVMFKSGMSPVALSWVSLAAYIVLGIIVKPWMIVKIAGYTWHEVISTFIPCAKVSILAGGLSCLICNFLPGSGLTALVLRTSCCLAISVPTVFFLGMTASMRRNILIKISSRLH